MNTKITAFWNWFEENKRDYTNFNKRYQGDPQKVDRMISKLVSKIQEYSEGLFVEVGSNDVPWELIITPQGIKQHFADAFELVNNAPQIEDWEIFASKPIIGENFNFKMGEIEINCDSIFFIPLNDDENPDEIAIRIFHKDYTEEPGPKKNAIVMGIYNALDTLLGEISATFDINYLDFSQEAPDDVKLLPITELVGYIKWKKKERAISGVKYPKDAISLLKGEKNELPVMRLVNMNYKYYEYTQEFPYALNVTLTFNESSSDGFPIEKMEEIYVIEDGITELVCKNEAGHYIASESHNGLRRTLLYHKSKEALSEKIKQLKIDFTTHKVDYKIVFDPFWMESQEYL